jgi:MraZ protein
VVGFLGSFQHQIDAKGRVSLPAQFRRGHEAEPFVLVQGQPDALSLYPADAWRKVEAELLDMKRRPEYRNKVLRLTANALQVVPDKQGRILIPERLRGSIELKSEALVIGAIDHIEIWNPERFASSTKADDDEFERYVTSILA